MSNEHEPLDPLTLAHLKESAIVHANILRGAIALSKQDAAHICGLTNVPNWRRIIGLEPPKTSRGYVLPEGWEGIDGLTYVLYTDTDIDRIMLLEKDGTELNARDTLWFAENSLERDLSPEEQYKMILKDYIAYRIAQTLELVSEATNG